MNIAVIPARGGSKRIPKKNIKDFLGKPMISYSISAAAESGLFDKIIVSTDSEEIAEVAKEYGAEIPFMRPKQLSDDFTGTAPVVKHVIEQMQAVGEWPKFICCIYATAPLLQAEFLIRAYKKIKSSNLDFVFSATSFAFPLQRAIKINRNELVEPAFPEFTSSRSQDLEEFYHDAGQFYWGTSAAWLDKAHVFTSRSQVEIMPRFLVQDIDTTEDWKQAELLYKSIK